MISVIIVNHDGEAHIGRCLASLDGSGAEVLLVDNASRDNSLSLVQERFPEVKIFSQEENLGFAAANNLAAAKANGEALLLLNADAWLEAGALDLLEEKLNTRPDVGLVAPRLRYPDGRRQFSWAPARGFVGEVLQKARNLFSIAQKRFSGQTRGCNEVMCTCHSLKLLYVLFNFFKRMFYDNFCPKFGSVTIFDVYLSSVVLPRCRQALGVCTLAC